VYVKPITLLQQFRAYFAANASHEKANLSPGIDWDDALHDVSYRVIVTNTANPPAELKNVIVSESEVTFNDLAPGTVKITIASRNSKGGESGPTSQVNATVP
jgi:hypothetical protein